MYEETRAEVPIRSFQRIQIYAFKKMLSVVFYVVKGSGITERDDMLIPRRVQFH